MKSTLLIIGICMLALPIYARENEPISLVVAPVNEDSLREVRLQMEKDSIMNSYTQIGRDYCLGSNGKSMNMQHAVVWFRKAAEEGYAPAQYELARCYMYGYGVAKNHEEMVYWTLLAAEQGYADAQNMLGVCYYRAYGVSQSYTEAVKWFLKAADQGCAEAQFNLARCYANGEGVEQSTSIARYWYGLAAEQGLPAAKNKLEQL